MTLMLDRPKAMKATEHSKDAAAAITKNIDGAFDFLRSVVDDPSLVDRIPHGATVYIAHDDDPKTTARNKASAAKTQRRGNPVYFHRVRVARVAKRPRVAYGGPGSNTSSGFESGYDRIAACAARILRRDRN